VVNVTSHRHARPRPAWPCIIYKRPRANRSPQEARLSNMQHVLNSHHTVVATHCTVIDQEFEVAVEFELVCDWVQNLTVPEIDWRAQTLGPAQTPGHSRYRLLATASRRSKPIVLSPADASSALSTAVAGRLTTWVLCDICPSWQDNELPCSIFASPHFFFWYTRGWPSVFVLFYSACYLASTAA
jgi:hypothetical protein